ncbi:MAG: thiamine diphosphokinase [Clostridia bacterium]|nr:thiamine diphosphokinase [Clostridia bacterium]
MIAADGGLKKLNDLGVKPDLILGDFDSFDGNPSGDDVLTYPVEKDDTDTMLAVKEALKRGYRTLWISGGVGGRLDHTVANLQTLLFAEKHGATAYLVSDSQTATIVADGMLTFSDACSGKLSVFSMGETAAGVTLRGLHYCAENISLTNAFPLGVSNAFTGETAEVSVRKGSLLVIWDGIPSDAVR